MITWNKQLKQLSAVISEECAARMAKDREVVPAQIAEWLIQRHRALAIAALTDLVHQAMAHQNDEAETEGGRITAMNDHDERLAYREFAMDKMGKLMADVAEVCELWEDMVEGRVPNFGPPHFWSPASLPQRSVAWNATAGVWEAAKNILLLLCCERMWLARIMTLSPIHETRYGSKRYMPRNSPMRSWLRQLKGSRRRSSALTHRLQNLRRN